MLSVCKFGTAITLVCLIHKECRHGGAAGYAQNVFPDVFTNVFTNIFTKVFTNVITNVFTNVFTKSVGMVVQQVMQEIAVCTATLMPVDWRKSTRLEFNQNMFQLKFEVDDRKRGHLGTWVRSDMCK